MENIRRLTAAASVAVATTTAATTMAQLTTSMLATSLAALQTTLSSTSSSMTTTPSTTTTVTLSTTTTASTTMHMPLPPLFGIEEFSVEWLFCGRRVASVSIPMMNNVQFLSEEAPRSVFRHAICKGHSKKGLGSHRSQDSSN